MSCQNDDSLSTDDALIVSKLLKNKAPPVIDRGRLRMFSARYSREVWFLGQLRKSFVEDVTTVLIELNQNQIALFVSTQLLPQLIEVGGHRTTRLMRCARPMNKEQ